MGPCTNEVFSDLLAVRPSDKADQKTPQLNFDARNLANRRQSRESQQNENN